MKIGFDNFEMTDSGLYLPKGTHSLQGNKSFWNSIFSALALVPIIGSLGYLLAFLREVGYTSYFGMPIDLIKLDTTNILDGVGSVLLLSLIILIPFILWIFSNYSVTQKPWLSSRVLKKSLKVADLACRLW